MMMHAAGMEMTMAAQFGVCMVAKNALLRSYLVGTGTDHERQRS
jgi:hypothetical protein